MINILYYRATFFDLLSARKKWFWEKYVWLSVLLSDYYNILHTFKLKNLSYSYSAISELYNSSSVPKNAFLKEEF